MLKLTTDKQTDRTKTICPNYSIQGHQNWTLHSQQAELRCSTGSYILPPPPSQWKWTSPGEWKSPWPGWPWPGSPARLLWRNRPHRAAGGSALLWRYSGCWIWPSRCNAGCHLEPQAGLCSSWKIKQEHEIWWVYTKQSYKIYQH